MDFGALLVQYIIVLCYELTATSYVAWWTTADHIVPVSLIEEVDENVLACK